MQSVADGVERTDTKEFIPLKKGLVHWS
jgi:hypothetical protein